MLRAVAGIALLFHTALALHSDGPVGSTIVDLLTGVVGTLLLIGLWTPITGSLLAILALWSAILHRADILNWVLLGALGAGLALLGPGAWSVDARLFGWKRVELPDRKS